jgi:hypothetical protein
MQGDGWHLGICHGAQELRLEDRRAGGKHSPVSRELLAVDDE